MKINTKATLAIYWRHLLEYRGAALAAVVMAMAGSSMGVIIPLYFKKFFDLLSSDSKGPALTAALISVLLSVAGLELLRWFFWRINLIFNAYYQPKVMAALANRCFSYLHNHSFSFFNNNFVGSLVKRINWFTKAFEAIADRVTYNLIPLVVDIIIIFFILAKKNAWLGIGIIVWIFIFLIINWFLTKYKLRYDLERSEAETKATGVLADTITNNVNVKLFGGYPREVGRFDAAVEVVRRLRHFTWTLDNIFDGVQGLMVIILEVGIFYTAIGLWNNGQVTIGDFVLIQSYIIIIFEKVWDFGKVIRHVYSDLADAEEMTVILHTPHEIQNVKNAKKLIVNQGVIQFRAVDFYYHKTRKIFSKLDFSIREREKIALVGPSGSGKSTILKLLLRMHEVAAGKIIIDGQRISHVTQESLWSAVSLVPQDPILFHRTLIENIRYGKPTATDAEVITAAKLAHCHEFISGFPDQYETYVGERGVKLSGGERQRVAIARAILRDAPVLVLDEATSSLDSESEHLIQDALNNLMRDKTVIVVAHRLSTIMKMDRIIVLNRGEIVEEGSHMELLKKKGGLYRELWRLQAGGFIQ